MSEVKTDKISSVSTNGDITLDPDGTGKLKVVSGGASQVYAQFINSTDNGKFEIKQGGSSNALLQGFNASNSETVRLDPTSDCFFNGGNVGIGTSSPNVTELGIEIHNSGNDTTAALRLSGHNNTGTPGQKFNTELRNNGGSGLFQVLHHGSGDSVGTERFRIDSGGDSYTNDGTISSLSDSRVKKEVADLQDGLAIVNQLRPVTFKYNGAASMAPDDDKVNYGFIADEVQAVASHYVTEGSDEINGVTVTDFKSLSTGRMLPMLFKAVQELSTKVQTLETEMTALKARVTALENA